MIVSQTTTVKSSTIDSLHYSTEDNILMIDFKHGITYSYLNVTVEDYLALISSESIGKALNQIIKGKYEYTKHEQL